MSFYLKKDAGSAHQPIKGEKGGGVGYSYGGSFDKGQSPMFKGLAKQAYDITKGGKFECKINSPERGKLKLEVIHSEPYEAFAIQVEKIGESKIVVDRLVVWLDYDGAVKSFISHEIISQTESISDKSKCLIRSGDEQQRIHAVSETRWYLDAVAKQQKINQGMPGDDTSPSR